MKQIESVWQEITFKNNNNNIYVYWNWASEPWQ